MAPLSLVLASASPFRRKLLARLGVPFTVEAPAIDETPGDDESAAALVNRLASAKAAHVAALWPESLVIGADQVAELDGTILGKPGNRSSAIRQLQQQSGRQVVFHTGLALQAPGSDRPMTTTETVITHFRQLSSAEIERYVDSEDVTATAGSIKAEGRGITLLEAIESSDPTTLIGLPLIALRRMLAAHGHDIP